MDRRLALVVTWLAATAVAVALAWTGVRLVVDQVVEPLPPAVTEVALSGTGVVPSPNPSATVGDAPGGAIADSATPPTTHGTDGTDGTDADPGTGTDDDAGAAPDTPGASSPPATSPPAAPASSSTTRTYGLVGGTVTVEFSSSRVQVLVATPNAGFSRELERSGPLEVSVRFSSDDHRSRIDASWEDGEPEVEIREEDRSDEDDEPDEDDGEDDDA